MGELTQRKSDVEKYDTNHINLLVAKDSSVPASHEKGKTRMSDQPKTHHLSVLAHHTSEDK